MHPLWFYKHQQDNPVRSKLFVACQRWWFLLHTQPVSWNCAYHLRMELSDGGSLPNLVRNCRWTIVTDRHSWNVSTQNAFSLPFAAILVNCAPSGEMHNYCTPHIIKKTLRISWSIGATTYCYIKCTVYDKLLKPRQSFRITLYLFDVSGSCWRRRAISPRVLHLVRGGAESIKTSPDCFTHHHTVQSRRFESYCFHHQVR